MNKRYKIYIVIISYRSYKDLNECLVSVINQKRIIGADINIIIVDGGSIKTSIESLKNKYPNIHIITKNENLGVGKSFNLGIKEALKNKADLVLLLTADVFMEDDVLLKLYKRIISSPKTAAVSAKLLYDRAQPKILFVSGKLDSKVKSTIHIGVKEVDKGQYDSFQGNDFLNCPVLIKASIFDQVGIFKEQFFMYYEDTDLYYRIKKKKFDLTVEPKAKAYTDYSDSSYASLSESRRSYYSSRNLLYFIKFNFNFREQAIAYTYIFYNFLMSLKFVVSPSYRSNIYYSFIGIKDFLLRVQGYKEIK